jgi:lipopolysaccharide export system protein LptA
MHIEQYLKKVRRWRIGSISAILLLLASLLLYPIIKSSLTTDLYKLTIAKQSDKMVLGMEKPIYKGLDGQLKPFTMTADKAVNQGKKGMLLTKPNGELVNDTNDIITMKALMGRNLMERNLLFLYHDVWLQSPDYNISSIFAKVDLQKRQISGDKHVVMNNSMGVTEADVFLIDTLTDTAFLEKNPKIIVDDKEKQEKTTIVSDSAIIYQLENRAVFTGNVVVVKSDMTLKADKMTAYFEQELNGTQKVIRKVEMNDNVDLLTHAENITGDRGIYQVAEEEVTIYDNVKLKREKSILDGDKLIYDVKTATSQLFSNQGNKVRVEVNDITSDKNKGNEANDDKAKK